MERVVEKVEVVNTWQGSLLFVFLLIFFKDFTVLSCMNKDYINGRHLKVYSKCYLSHGSIAMYPRA